MNEAKVLPVPSSYSFNNFITFFCSEEDFPDIYRLFPRAKIKFIPDSRHWLVLEKPVEFAQMVTEFLEESLQDQKNPLKYEEKGEM